MSNKKPSHLFVSCPVTCKVDSLSRSLVCLFLSFPEALVSSCSPSVFLSSFSSFLLFFSWFIHSVLFSLSSQVKSVLTELSCHWLSFFRFKSCASDSFNLGIFISLYPTIDLVLFSSLFRFEERELGLVLQTKASSEEEESSQLLRMTCALLFWLVCMYPFRLHFSRLVLGLLMSGQFDPQKESVYELPCRPGLL